MELGEWKPLQKLPFNNGDDPWMAAHNFLQDNDMSPKSLGLVCKFIIEKTKYVTIGPPEVQYKDPFSEVKPQTKAPEVQCFPEIDFLGFNHANMQAILGNLREFNRKMG